MAQSPETKSTNATLETAAQSDGERRARSAANQTMATEQSLTAAGTNAAQQGSEAMRDTTRDLGSAMRQSGSASAEATRATAQAGAEVGRRGAEALAQGQRELLEQVASRFERIGRHMADAAQESAADFRSFVMPPQIPHERLRELQESVSGLVNGVVQSNMRATQELLRLTDPGSVFNLQRRFVRDYLDTLLQGTGTFVRIVQQTADQTLHPIEQRLEARERDRQQDNERHHTSRHDQQHHGVVSDVMSSHVRFAGPDDTVQQATRIMREEDTGVLPVGEGDRLVGIVTDRDVTLRLVAEGKDPARTKVREVMTQDVKYVFEDEDLGHVADNMAEQQVRRLPVVNRSKRVVGVISLGDLTRADRDGRYAGKAMRGPGRDSGMQMPGAAE